MWKLLELIVWKLCGLWKFWRYILVAVVAFYMGGCVVMTCMVMSFSHNQIGVEELHTILSWPIEALRSI